MTRVAIPHGLLPPFSPGDPTSFDRSPYVVALTDVVLRYATSVARRRILDGFLRFREDLNATGLQSGFQWLDGSFLENIELIESRSPRDIDVVTFYYLPPGASQSALLNAHPAIFNPVQAKPAYHVDAYFVQLNTKQPEGLVKLTAYWYSVWSHRRNDLWKGYLQVDLDPADGPDAKANLAAISSMGGSA